MRPFDRLEAGRVAYDLALAVYRETKTWPQDERFGLIAQVRRAAFSIPANIAEGASRRGRKDFARYLNIALGSQGRLLWRPYAAMRKGDSDGA